MYMVCMINAATFTNKIQEPFSLEKESGATSEDFSVNRKNDLVREAKYCKM